MHCNVYLLNKLLHCLPGLLEGRGQLPCMPQVTPLVAILILLIGCERPVDL